MSAFFPSLFFIRYKHHESAVRKLLSALEMKVQLKFKLVSEEGDSRDELIQARVEQRPKKGK